MGRVTRARWCVVDGMGAVHCVTRGGRVDRLLGDAMLDSNEGVVVLRLLPLTVMVSLCWLIIALVGAWSVCALAAWCG